MTAFLPERRLHRGLRMLLLRHSIVYVSAYAEYRFKPGDVRSDIFVSDFGLGSRRQQQPKDWERIGPSAYSSAVYANAMGTAEYSRKDSFSILNTNITAFKVHFNTPECQSYGGGNVTLNRLTLSFVFESCFLAEAIYSLCCACATSQCYHSAKPSFQLSASTAQHASLLTLLS